MTFSMAIRHSRPGGVCPIVPAPLTPHPHATTLSPTPTPPTTAPRAFQEEHPPGIPSRDKAWARGDSDYRLGTSQSDMGSVEWGVDVSTWPINLSDPTANYPEAQGFSCGALDAIIAAQQEAREQKLVATHPAHLLLALMGRAGAPVFVDAPCAVDYNDEPPASHALAVLQQSLESVRLTAEDVRGVCCAMVKNRCQLEQGQWSEYAAGAPPPSSSLEDVLRGALWLSVAQGTDKDGVGDQGSESEGGWTHKGWGW